MTNRDRLIQSDAWDPRFHLPTFPKFNNPWIYMAYAQAVLRCTGEALLFAAVWVHFQRCEEWTQPGLFWRWPDRSGGMTSWDEILGAAYLDRMAAQYILDYLDQHGGVFNNTGESDGGNPLRFNVYRMPFMRPFLVAASGESPSLLSKLIWAGHIILAASDNTRADNAGGRLRNWLMFRHMSQYWICRRAIRMWIRKMEEAGLTLKGSLALEPGDKHPILGELAPEGWVYE